MQFRCSSSGVQASAGLHFLEAPKPGGTSHGVKGNAGGPNGRECSEAERATARDAEATLGPSAARTAEGRRRSHQPAVLALLRSTYYAGRNMKDVKLLILTSLSDGPKHGYAIQADIEVFAGMRLGPGTLYGAISRLEQSGMISSVETDDRRKPYRLTAGGRAALTGELGVLQRVLARAATA